MRIASSLFLGLWAAACAAQQPCARTPLDEYVERGSDLLIGESHGVVESPELVRCLVLTALARKGAEPLVVSLEHTPGARDLAGRDWQTRDGRSSIAMWDLAKFLFEQEKLGRLTVAFHMPVIQAARPEDIPDGASYEKLMANLLSAPTAKNQVIALVGNFHSRKIKTDWMPYEPAGVHVGDAMLHVAVEGVAPGSAWSQMNGGYKSRDGVGGNLFAGQKPGTLVDGKTIEHDLVYLVPRYTASGPRYP
jgi:hypothetical protein